MSTGLRPMRSDSSADQRRDQDDDHRGDGRQPQRRAFAQRAGRGQEGGHVGDADIISDRAQRRDGEGAGDAARGGWRSAWRSGLSGTVPLVALAVEFGRFRASSSGRSTRCRRARRRRRRGCASPSARGRLAHARRRSAPRRRPRASRRPRSPPRPRRRSARADARRRAFEQIGDDAGIFAADREPHDAAQEEQQPAGRGADRGAGRQAMPSPASPRSSARPTAAACAAGRMRSPIWPKKTAPSGRIR